MPRHEQPVGGDDAIAQFAIDLRRLRQKVGSPPYRQLARRALFSPSALADAASGRRLPSLAVTLAYVRACGGDVVEWEARWHALAAETAYCEPTSDGVDANGNHPPKANSAAADAAPRRTRWPGAVVAAGALALALFAVLWLVESVGSDGTSPVIPHVTTAAPVPGNPPLISPVSEDTYVSQLDRDVAKGALKELLVCGSICATESDAERRVLLKFSITELPDSSCVSSATLQLWSRTTTPESNIYTLHRTDPNSWSEATATWNNQPTLGPLVASRPGSPAANWLTFDITSVVTGNGIYSFQLRQGGNEFGRFSTHEDPVANRPAEIVVQYTQPGSDNCPRASA
ncbi:DNRLRE domain-containing protein [Nocardia sp. CDC159]|uniref:DNRLRE domain-containing protein n=1 Tax=Nocardia pulmonis TaxID=2951408 RepID=A0A9X2E5L5_9NOCA|nr:MULTISPECIES: DNRLRE domain-containing protein [Nocardia]MCM6773508.1 DNRLRE domain-containing protein [Nocardia pulmonis]MCM6786395.1 DNRLRE domain-containing protein [Nocardia sp. CDC159]